MSNLNDGGVAWNPITNLIMEVIQAALARPLIFCPLYWTRSVIFCFSNTRSNKGGRNNERYGKTEGSDYKTYQQRKRPAGAANHLQCIVRHRAGRLKKE